MTSQPRLCAQALLDRAREHGDKLDIEIARRVRLTQSTVSRLLTGQTTPSLSSLVALRAAYGISLDELVPVQDDAPKAGTAPS
ncbi:helix-turn-helix domain-containing protein [Streptomyces ardesiacus]